MTSSITIRVEHRRAEIRGVNSFWLKYNKVEAAESIPCSLVGVFQCDDDEYTGPTCVVELDDGRLVQVVPEYVRMLKEEENEDNCN